MRCVGVAILILLISVASARTEKNSYLETRVSTVAQLVHEVKTNRIVASRYMRHFAMSKPQVLRYFQALYKDRLPSDTKVVMYSVPQGEWIKSHTCTLRKGTYVFRNHKGQLVLRLICGNPIRPAGQSDFTLYPQPNAQVGNSEGPKAAGGGGVAAPADAVVEVVEPPVPVAPEVPLTVNLAPPAPLQPVTPANPDVVNPAPVAGMPGVPTLTSTSVDWGILPALAGAFTVGSHGGGGGTRTHVPAPPAVPEPCAMIGLAVAALGLGRSRMKRTG